MPYSNLETGPYRSCFITKWSNFGQFENRTNWFGLQMATKPFENRTKVSRQQNTTSLDRFIIKVS
jgi:hypothetical protein